ncbi:PAS domain-containing protein, partial [Dissulfuribacter thermophilus]|uniref:PAS domain-containing protein n=1 Tax=Dissulfuribacter thermophilus TaxID=1156395 RepID=UPI00137B8E79
MIRSLIDHAPCSIWVANPTGTVEYANKEALKLFGVTSIDQIARQGNIFDNSFKAKMPCLDDVEYAYSGDIIRCLGTVKLIPAKNRESEEIVHLETTIFSVPPGGGPTADIVVIQKDITKLVNHIQRIKQLESILRVISNINQLIVRNPDRDRLLEETCRTIGEIWNDGLVWIDLLHEEGGPRLIMAQAGSQKMDTNLLKTLTNELKTAGGPIDTALRTGMPTIIRDAPETPFGSRWTETARLGFNTVVAIVISHRQRRFGTINILLKA